MSKAPHPDHAHDTGTHDPHLVELLTELQALAFVLPTKAAHVPTAAERAAADDAAEDAFDNMPV